MFGMDMSEKMRFEIVERGKIFEKFLRAILDAIIEIKDAICRRMSNQDVGVVGDLVIVAALAFGYAISHKHGYAVEFQSVNLYAGVT